MAGADEGFFPRPEKRTNPVFGNGSAQDPYFEQDEGQQPSADLYGAPRQFPPFGAAEDRGVPSGEFLSSTGFTGSNPSIAAGRTSDKNRPMNLGDDEVRLPWLEGEDDFEVEKGGLSQGVLLGGLGLLAILLFGLGIFWMVRSDNEEVLVADGGVIEAPAEPYKTRPEDPGGEFVSGTGDTSFAVAEGQTRLPQMVDRTPPMVPMPTPTASETKAASAESTAPAQNEPVVQGVGVQVGAYASKEKALAGWQTLQVQYAPLASMHHRIIEGRADFGTVYRLQAVPGDLAAARNLCSGMKAAGLNCQVKN